MRVRRTGTHAVRVSFRGRRFRTGQRLEARVVRTLGGRFVVLDVEHVRLVAWMEHACRSGDELYLEVVSSGPAPRFRRLTGGPAFWAAPVGRRVERVIDARG